MRLLFLGCGIVLLIAALIDVVWTAVGTHGGGPLSKRLSKALWKLARAIFRWNGNHRMLSFAGSIILLFVVVMWISLVWAGWTLVFSSDPESLRNAQTSAPVDSIGRVYFVAYTISSMGNGDFQPNGHAWQIATAIAALGGIGTLTLAITFVLQVLTAVVEKRALGAYVSDMGGTPRCIIERSWTGEGFDSLEQHFVQLTAMIHLYTEQHLAYPVLHYFHSENDRTASTLRMAALEETLLLISAGVPVEKRLSRMVTMPLRDALNGFAGVIMGEWVAPERQPPVGPNLDILRELGIPTVSDDEFAKAVDRDDKVRRFLVALLHDDAWEWEEWARK